MSNPVEISWTLEEAQKFVDQSAILFATIDLGLKIVGSVATRGYSNNDLDILLIPKKSQTLDEAISKIERNIIPLISVSKYLNPLESGSYEAWFLPIEIKDGRLIELYLPLRDFPLAENLA